MLHRSSGFSDRHKGSPRNSKSKIRSHNLDFQSVNTDYEFATACDAPPAAQTQDRFMGYKRAGGGVGTRNYIAVLTSVNCSATAARHIANAFGDAELADYPNVDGVVAYVHGTGCGMAGQEGFDALTRVMTELGEAVSQVESLMAALNVDPAELERVEDRLFAMRAAARK